VPDLSAYRFTKTHEWVSKEEGAGEVVVGITDLAQTQLGDVIFLELPKVGATLTAGPASARLSRSRPPATSSRR